MTASEEEWDGGRLREVSPEWADRVIFLEECGSTNDEARRLVREGLRGSRVVLTERQTAGRGRRGQPWVCPPGKGLACSWVMFPEEPVAMWSRLSLAAGLAVAEALDAFGIFAGVKWPNDVWVKDRKICGILVESNPPAVVVGMGLNINVDEFPEGLAHPATSLSLETGKKWVREEVLVAILKRLEFRASQIGSQFPELLDAWSTRCVLRGRRVRLEANGLQREGVMEGLSLTGELLLRTEAGVERILHADTIRIANP
ncbi:MAG: biotin--[acetyl-CoA-carboxylase] ligase [Verrucomicrobiaceae bacterium]